MRKIVALGATSLIAQETLKNFAKDKDSFFLIGRNEEKLNEVAKNLEVLGASEVNVKVVKDVCDFKAHQEIINEADKMLSNFDNFFVKCSTANRLLTQCPRLAYGQNGDF